MRLWDECVLASLSVALARTRSNDFTHAKRRQKEQERINCSTNELQKNCSDVVLLGNRMFVSDGLNCHGSSNSSYITYNKSGRTFSAKNNG